MGLQLDRDRLEEDMIVVVVTSVLASVLGVTKATGATLMSLSADTLHVALRSYLYGERLSNVISVSSVKELAFPRCLGNYCLSCIRCRRQEVPEI